MAECKLVTTRQIGVGFINGVNTSEADAKINANKLYLRLHRPVTLFYNQTEGLTLDLLEVFEQITAELPPEIRNRYELYHEFLLGGGELSDRLSVVVSGLPKQLRLFSAKHATLTRQTIKRPITYSDYAEHNRQLRLMVADNDRVVLVAHSQGNLFANHAFEQLGAAEQKKVGIAHVAPASVRLHGGYVLADKDLTITPMLLRLPTAIIPLPGLRPAPTDWQGHGFVEIYLNEGMAPYLQVIALIQVEIDKVPVPGLYGTYRSAATWHNARHITWSGISVLSGDHGTWTNETYHCSGISVRDKDNVWHTLTLQGSCVKESISVSEEILQRNGSVYQVTGVSRDLATGQTWGGISRCANGIGEARHRQRKQPSLKELWSIP